MYCVYQHSAPCSPHARLVTDDVDTDDDDDDDTYSNRTFVRQCRADPHYDAHAADVLYPPLFLACLQTGPIEDVRTFYPVELGRGAQGRVYTNHRRRVALKRVKHVWGDAPQYVLLEMRPGAVEFSRIKSRVLVGGATADHNDDVWLQRAPLASVHSFWVLEDECVPLRTTSSVADTDDDDDDTHRPQFIQYIFSSRAAARQYRRNREALCPTTRDAPVSTYAGPFFHVCSCFPADPAGTGTGYVWRLPPNLLDAYVGRAFLECNVFAHTDAFVYMYDECRTHKTSESRGLDGVTGGAHDWDQYIWMECIQGPSLLQHCWGRAPFGTAGWWHILLQVLGALAAAQDACDYKHHDLTTQNVFMRVGPHANHDDDDDGALSSSAVVTLGVELDAHTRFVITGVPRAHLVAVGDHGFASVRYGTATSGVQDRVTRFDIESFSDRDSSASSPPSMGPWSAQLDGAHGYDVQTFLNTVYLFAGNAADTLSSAQDYTWARLAELYKVSPTTRTQWGRPQHAADVSDARPHDGLALLLARYPHRGHDHNHKHDDDDTQGFGVLRQVDAHEWRRHRQQAGPFFLCYSFRSE